MNLRTTWKQLILRARLSSEENNQIISDLSTAANDTKCMDIAKVIRNGAFFVKVKDQLQLSLVHSFSQAEGNAMELGYGRRNRSSFPALMKRHSHFRSKLPLCSKKLRCIASATKRFLMLKTSQVSGRSTR